MQSTPPLCELLDELVGEKHVELPRRDVSGR